MFSDLEQKVGTKAVVHFGPVSAEKQRIAEEVASMLKLNVDIDTTSSERLVSFSFLPSVATFCLRYTWWIPCQ